MSTLIKFHDEGRAAMIEGIQELSKAISITAGPRGQNVILPNGKMTNDGVSVGRVGKSSNPWKQQGYEVIQDITESINEVARDGTTAGATLGGELCLGGLKLLSVGMNAMMIRKGMEKAVLDAKEHLKTMSRPAKNLEDVICAATVSAESEEIGKVIAETVWKTGKNGVVTVEESPIPGITSVVVEGLQFEKGYVSPYMVNRPDKMQVILENIPIIITDRVFTYGKDILPLMQAATSAGYVDIVIVAEDFGESAVKTLIHNRMLYNQFNGSKGGIRVLAIKAPLFDDRKKAFLQDLAVVTKAIVVDEACPVKLSMFESEDMEGNKKRFDQVSGMVKTIECSKNSTIVKGSNPSGLASHIATLDMALREEKLEFVKEKIKERIAKLAGGIAVIRVGAETEKGLQYLKDKIDDAIHTSQNAISEGVVAGGGAALAHVQSHLKTYMEILNKGATDEFMAGYRLVIDSLTAPLRSIVENSGDSPDVVIDKITRSKVKGFGYNALTMQYENLLDKGIVDALMTVRTSIEKAVEGAALWLTSGAVFVTEPEKEMT